MQHDSGVATALAVVGTLFVLVQVLAPIQSTVSTNLGDRLTAHLNDRLLAASVGPSGLGHLESPDLIDDLAIARDIELGLYGPPMSMLMILITDGLVQLFAGVAQLAVLGAYHWWVAVLVGAGWLSTHVMLRTPSVWAKDTGDVLADQRRAEYAYRLAMDSPAAKEVRVFGLSEWVVARFAGARRALVDARWAAARLPASRVALTSALVIAANVVCFLLLAHDASSGLLSTAKAVTFVQAAVGASAIAFGGLNWAFPHAAHAVAAVLTLEPAMHDRGTLPDGHEPADTLPAREIRFRDVGFCYTPDSPAVLRGLDLTIPAGTSMAVVGVNGAGKTTLVKLLCRLYDPTSGRIEVDGVDLRRLSVDSWRGRLSAIFQDYVRYDLSLRQNVAPLGGTDDDVLAALDQAGIGGLAELDTVLATGYPGGRDLSGGQWQRVALARVLHAVQRGAGVVILDEPTAQLDVRGEAEVFRQLLAATRGCTTILISHRFATVRLVDRICVLEHGKVVQVGTHDELIAAGGRYRTMYELQASRFDQEESDDDVVA